MVKQRATPHLDRLFKRVRSLTKAYGAQSRLAELIGTTPQRLNDWLSGLYEPGGEITLQLLEWVTAEEAKKRKSAARAGTRATPKTQVKKPTTNEKRHSGRRPK